MNTCLLVLFCLVFSLSFSLEDIIRIGRLCLLQNSSLSWLSSHNGGDMPSSSDDDVDDRRTFNDTHTWLICEKVEEVVCLLHFPVNFSYLLFCRLLLSRQF